MWRKFSRWSPWWPSWISEQNHFSNSKSPCCPVAFHQVSAPSNWLIVRGQITTDYFQDGHGDLVWRFSRWLTWQPSWISELNDFSNSKSPCGLRSPTKVGLNLTLGTGADVVSRFSRWPPMRLNPTYGLGDVVWRISRWPPWRPS